MGDRLPEVTQKPFLGSSSLSLQCQHSERARKCLQGWYFVRCRHSTHGLLFRVLRGSPGGGGAVAVCDPNPPRPCARSRKKQHKHKFFGPDFPRTFLTLTLECPGVKKFLPATGPQENALFGADVHDFRRGRP